MPSKSKAQQRFFGVVKGIQKGTGKGSGKAKTAAKDMSSTDVDDFVKTKKKRYYGYGGLGGPSEPNLSLNLGDKDIQEPVAQTFLGKKTRGQTGIAWA